MRAGQVQNKISANATVPDGLCYIIVVQCRSTVMYIYRDPFLPDVQSQAAPSGSGCRVHNASSSIEITPTRQTDGLAIGSALLRGAVNCSNCT
jgi:hypothetical protein